MKVENGVKRSWATWLVSLVAVGFGIMTLKSGGLVLFGPEQYANAAGDYVPFVLWFNFLAGVFYILTGVLLYFEREIGKWLAILIAVTTVGVFGAFGLHILNGGAFEYRTVGAMSLRSLVWICIAVFIYRKRPQVPFRE